MKHGAPSFLKSTERLSAASSGVARQGLFILRPHFGSCVSVPTGVGQARQAYVDCVT
jgi:hypothetical protein